MATQDQGSLNWGHSNVTRLPSNIFTNRRGDDARYGLNRSAQDQFSTRQYLAQGNLRERLQMLRDREKAAHHHNRQLMQQFGKAQDALREMMAKTATMKTIRMEYERYLEENYPRWQQQLKIKTEAAQRKMMDDCLKICMRNTAEQARLAAAQDFASQGQHGMSGRDSACGTSRNCKPVTNHDDQTGPPAHPAQHQTRLRVESDCQFLQGQGRPDHTSPMWAMDLATGSKALLHHLNTAEPAEGGLSCDELDTQPVRLRWSSAGSGDDSRQRMSENRWRNRSGSQRSPSTSSEIIVSPGQHSETADSRRLLGVEWRGESVGDNQLRSEGQSERSSEESGCSGMRQENGVAGEQHGDRREERGGEDEEDEDSLVESDEVSLGRSTTEDEDTEEDMDKQEGEELNSDEDEKIKKKESDEGSNEEEEDGKECDHAEQEGDDSDDCIITPKTRSKELKVISEEVSENEDNSDKDSSDGDSNESSDEDIERLLAPRQLAQKESEEKSRALRKEIFQVGRSESLKPDPQSDPDSFYD